MAGGLLKETRPAAEHTGKKEHIVVRRSSLVVTPAEATAMANHSRHELSRVLRFIEQAERLASDRSASRRITKKMFFLERLTAVYVLTHEEDDDGPYDMLEVTEDGQARLLDRRSHYSYQTLLSMM